MQVFRDLHQLPEFQNSVITIGTFDGVHLGHRVILDQITADARSIGGKSMVITFHPHPRQVISPDLPLHVLTTPEEKLAIFETCGIDSVVVVPFSREFSEMEAEDYAEHFLIKKFNPRIIVFGYDHHFGKDRKGDIKLLKQIAAQYQITVTEIPAHVIDHITVSSTRIRNFIASGNIDEANHLLGYRYSLTGHVVKGDQIGRTIGFPTANIRVDDETKLIPGHGVYLTSVKRKQSGQTYFGLLNIGTRPTFNKTEKRIEVYLLDFNETIYGEEMTVEFIEWIRADKKFSSEAELIDAIKGDEQHARKRITFNS